MTAAERALVATLAVAGLAVWWVFWGGGAFGMVGHDWPKEAHYLDTLRRALADLSLPFYRGVDAQGSPRFLANPELPVTPQLLLLPWVGNGSFVMLDAMLLWLIGLWGCVRFKRRWRLDGLAFAALVLLFSFNGHVTAHLAVGHSMWVGYFIAPHVMLHLFRLIEGDAGAGNAVGLGMWLAAMMLQGSFHLVVYLLMLIGTAGLLLPGGLAFTLGTGAVCAVLAAVKVVPAVVSFPSPAHAYLSGYPDPATLLAGLTGIRRVDAPFVGSYGENPVGWWEYDAYVGPAGLLFLAWFGIRPLLAADAGRRALAWACLVMVVLSFGEVVWLATGLGVPVLGQERVPARFLVAPLLVLIFMAARGWAELGPRQTLTGWLGVGLIAAGLLTHLLVWRLPVVELDPLGSWQLRSIAAQPSALYEWVWLLSAAVSVSAWVVAGWWSVRRRLRP